MRTTARRTLTALCLAGLVAGAGSAAAAPAKPKLGPNLVANPSFEKEAVAVPGQPVLPADWGVEGVSVFEHRANLFKEGARSVTLSGTLGGKQICDGSSGEQRCTANPATAATDPLPLRAAWVTEAPIAVAAGKKYRFSSWIIPVSLNPNDGVAGEGALTRVRWLGAGGAVLSTAEGPKLVKGPKRTLGWKLQTADVVAPAGATGAQLLLGYTDFTTTALQHGFDAVSFALVK
jgi:hypothetical protein